MSLATAYAEVRADMRNFGRDVEHGVRRVNPDKAAGEVGKKAGESMAKRAMLAFGALFAADKVKDILSDAVEGASAVSEAQSKVGVVFGSSANQIVEASTKSAKAMGLSQRAYLESTGTLGNLFVSMGLAKPKAAGMSQTMVKLAGDLASFNNENPEDVLVALKAGLVGETEPLRRFGVNLNEAAIKAEAMRLGLVKATKDQGRIEIAQKRAKLAQEAYTEAVKKHGKNSEEARRAEVAMESSQRGLNIAVKGAIPQLNSAQKAQASYSLIMQQSKTAQGDFQRTSKGLANQQRILAATWEDMKNKLGAKLLPAVTAVTSAFGAFLSGMMNGTGAGGRFVDVLKSMGHWLGQHTGLLKGAAIALGTLVAVTKIHAAVLAIQQGRLLAWFLQTKIVMATTKAWAAVQWVLNAALSANPLGLIVVAIAAVVGALIYAWKNSDIFRQRVTAAWNAVKVAAGAVWGFLQGVYKQFIEGWHQMTGAAKAAGSAIVAAWHWLGQQTSRAWNAIRGATSAAWNAIKAVLSTVWNAIKVVFTGYLNIYRAILTRAWNLIRGVTTATWNGIKAVLTAVWSGIRTVVVTYTNIVRTVITRAWSLISTGVRTTWNGIKSIISTVWSRGIHPVFLTIRSGVDLVARAFGRAASGIRTAWDKVRGYAASPIRFVVNTVLNNGVIKAFNWISGKIGGPHVDNIKLGFAGGGIMPGYTPGRDVHQFISADGRTRLGLSGGEAIMRPEFARMVGGERGVKALNEFAQHNYSGGGIIDWIKNKAGSVVGKVKSVASDVWNFVTDPAKAFSGIVDKVANSGVGKYGRAAVAKLIGVAVRKIKSLFTSFSDSGFGGGGDFGAHGGSAKANQAIAAAMLSRYGWSANQMKPLVALWNGESGWNQFARNPSSGAYGIPQSLPASKLASAGADWRTNPATQIRWGLGYIKSVYGSPANAYSRWLARSPHWYDTGGMMGPGQWGANGGTRPERVLSGRQTEAFERMVQLLEAGHGFGGGGPNISVVNHYPQAEPTSVTVNRSLRYVAAMGL